MEELPLKTVRPMLFRTVNLAEDGPDVSKAKNEKEAQMKVESFLISKYNLQYKYMLYSYMY